MEVPSLVLRAGVLGGRGSALSWTLADGVIELALHREPCNELGSVSLA